MYDWLVLPILLIILLYFIYRGAQKLTSGVCDCKTDLSEKVAIVTGSNTGIGFETAKELAARNAKVILACRDELRGKHARDAIIKATGNRNVVYKHLDLASFKSVREFAKEILEKETQLDILINNAGTGKLDNSLTENHLPIEVQINHFGPFLLTNLLLPLLDASAPSRIINVTSMFHKFGKVDPETFHLQCKTKFHHMRVYSDTKLANILFTKKLAKDLRGTDITVNCLHPGGVSTDMFRHRSSLTRFLLSLVLKTPKEGAQTSIHLAVAPELEEVTGKYFEDCEKAEPSKAAQDRELAEKLWDLSVNVTKIHDG